MEELLQIGIITSTHGLKGEVKVFPTTDDPRRFKKLRQAVLDTGKEKINVEIESARLFKQYVILKMKGFDRIEDVERLSKKSLYVTRSNAVPLAANEYFIADLIGIKVYLEDESYFGIIRDVMQTGANDVYVIDSEHYGEVLVPAIHQCILSVRIEEQRMTIHLLDGLVDE